MVSVWIKPHRVSVVRALAICLAFASVGWLASRASAQTETQTATYALTDTDYGYNTNTSQNPLGYQVADNSTFLTLNQYNPAAHAYSQLASVTITWTATVTIESYLFTNISSPSTSQTFSETMEGQAVLFQPGSTTVWVGYSSGQIATGSQTLPATGDTYGSTGPTVASTNADVNVIPGGADPLNPPATTWAASFLAPYSGNGTINFDITGSAVDTFSGSGGNVSQSVVTEVGGSVTVLYTWIQVPEPSAWAFMGAGVTSGLFALRRRRQAKRR